MVGVRPAEYPKAGQLRDDRVARHQRVRPSVEWCPPQVHQLMTTKHDLRSGAMLLGEHRNRQREVVAVQPEFKVNMPDSAEAVETRRQARGAA